MKEQFFKYIFGVTSTKEFEDWLYNDSTIERKLGQDSYLELISMNFNSDDFKSKLTDFIKSHFDWKEYLNWERIQDEKRMDEIGKSEMTIDLQSISSGQELHALLKERLKFPDFYGNNRHALWDAITGLVAMPKTLTFKNWNIFSERLPFESKMLEEIIFRYNNIEYNEKKIKNSW